MELRRRARDQELHERRHCGAGQEMEIVEQKMERRLERADLVEEIEHEALARVRAVLLLVDDEGVAPDGASGMAQRRDQRGDEAALAAVGFLQRQPRDVLAGGDETLAPLRQQRGLAEARGRGDHGERAGFGVRELGERQIAHQQMAAILRRLQLRAHDGKLGIARRVRLQHGGCPGGVAARPRP